jgi:hypothetical protein
MTFVEKLRKAPTFASVTLMGVVKLYMQAKSLNPSSQTGSLITKSDQNRACLSHYKEDLNSP